MIQVIYIPGLGDERVALQRSAVKLWRIWGVQPHVFQMHWSDSVPYVDKFARLTAMIDALSHKGPVALVGASAGASTVVHAYSECPQVTAVVCIAGKVNNPQSIGQSYKTRALSFWESAQQAPAALGKLSEQQKRRILSIRAMVDMIVPARDSTIQGAHNRKTWTSGHAVTIANQLVFGAPFFLRFIRQSSARQV